MACLLFCRCAFFENNNCIHFTVCASLSDLDYLRKVETEPTKVLMLDSNHQVRADGLLMSVLMKVQGQVCNLSWYLYSTIQPKARLAALLSCCMYSAFILWGPLSNLVNWHCGHCSGTVAWSLNMCRHCSLPSFSPDHSSYYNSLCVVIVAWSCNCEGLMLIFFFNYSCDHVTIKVGVANTHLEIVGIMPAHL